MKRAHTFDYLDCDEALAVSLLMQLPEFSNHSVLRTRDLEALAKCDIVVRCLYQSR